MSKHAIEDTRKALLAGELYVPCPRCLGAQLLYATFETANGERGEYVTCPCCSGTKEADAEVAREWLAFEYPDEEAI